MMEGLDVQVLEGDGTRAEILTQPAASKADIVVAVTQSDNVNMLACTLSRRWVRSASSCA